MGAHAKNCAGCGRRAGNGTPAEVAVCTNALHHVYMCSRQEVKSAHQRRASLRRAMRRCGGTVCTSCASACASAARRLSRLPSAPYSSFVSTYGLHAPVRLFLLSVS